MKDALIIFAVILIVIGCFLIGTVITMWLWNTLAHYFGFKTINFWIALLITIIWGSFTQVHKNK